MTKLISSEEDARRLFKLKEGGLEGTLKQLVLLKGKDWHDQGKGKEIVHRLARLFRL